MKIGDHKIAIISRINPVLSKDEALLIVESIAKAVATVPQEQMALIRHAVSNPVANLDDPYWAVKYNQPAFTAAATAGAERITYYPVSLANASMQDFYDSTTIHETGRLMNERLWSNPVAESNWLDAVRADDRVPSAYARNSPKEDFAESVTAYLVAKGTSDESAARQLFPERSRLLALVFSAQPAPPQTARPRRWPLTPCRHVDF